LNLSEWFFWVFVLLILYTYFGYPVLLFLASLLINKPVDKGEFTSSVSIIIAVHNEEKIIKKKIENTLSLDYPQGKREIIVISDCSQDSTDQMVRKFEMDEVKFFSLKQRKGKDYAQGVGIDQAKGEIMVFTDAAAMLEKNALLNIVRNFNDPTVGCVTSEDRVLSDERERSEEGSYVKYEMMLRRLESQVCSVVGLSGSFFAIRRGLCEGWAPRYTSDFLLPIRSVMAGYRAINDPSAIAHYKTLPSLKHEFKRKVRTVASGLAVLIHSLRILNPFRFGFFSVQVASHKLLRWLVPFLLVLVLVTSLYLVETSPLYLSFFIAQILFYFLAGLAFVLPSLNKTRILRIPLFFCLVNLSILVAWLEIIGGKTHFVWEPSPRE
jgi:cellulose synthase/poly-beta-1,6-N-acetylglucosamine synthase-like glycosyltransferase